MSVLLTRITIAMMFLCSAAVFAQGSFQGTVQDTVSNPISRAIIQIRGISEGAYTNKQGTFTFNHLPQGTYIIEIRAYSYRALIDTIQIVQQTLTKIYQLKSAPIQLREAIIVADRLVDQNAVSEVRLTASDLQHKQGLLEDPIRALSTLPGIGHGGDLFSPSPIYIRGGAPEENLFLIDNARVYWPWYFGGQKSIFNSETIESVELYPSGFNAKYGDALSSVLNVSTRDGSRSHVAGSASIGFYNSHVTLEGPITKDISFLVSGRRTYLDLFLKESAEFPVPSFWDVTYKATAQISETNKISISGLNSSESINFLTPDPTPGLPNKLETSGTNGFNSLQWQSILSDDLYSKLSLTYARFTSSTIVGRNLDLTIHGKTFGAREDVTAFLTKNLRISGGAEYTTTSLNLNGTLPYSAGDIDPNDTTIRLRSISVQDPYWTSALYASSDLTLGEDVGITAGLRLDHHSLLAKNDLSPRFAISYKLGEHSTIRGAYGYYRQFPSSEGLERNTDLLSNRALHYTLGISHSFTPSLSGWVEVYRKEYSDLVIFDTTNNYLNTGTGRAQGIEAFLRKEGGLFRGWISYAYSISKRKDAEDQSEYYFDYDQRHIVNTTIECNLKEFNLSTAIPAYASITVRAANGRPYTPTISAVQTPDGWMPIKGDRNSERDPMYLNINLRLEWHFSIIKEGDFQSFIEIWNLFSNKNVLGRSYQYGTQYPNNVLVQSYYTTPILPAGGFKFVF